jgi:hypothetical protein
VIACLALVGYVFSRPAIPQDLDYHKFADERIVLGLVNGLNVLSNIPFLLVGIAGCWAVIASASRSAPGAEWLVWPYLACFLGIALITFGSGYYHLAPDNQCLVWDRLPMTLAFMGLLSAVIGERVGRRPLQIVFGPLLLAGLASVLYWSATEQAGRGDLRLYMLVQYGSLTLIVLLLLLYPPRYTHTGYLWAALSAYAVAKLFEAADHQVYAVGHVISGHTLKHLAAAGGVACIVRMIQVRTPLASGHVPHDPTGARMQGLQRESEIGDW